ncbi:phytolongin Phyl1.2 isoform X2 [Brassica napus]|uniref:phytolongin Phyl1.2 isoform X2 n=2 Tax=Brassica napus TaxID=3708 RepID=UPI000BBEFDCB|nr:phytolongin Phyl1.2 isoform X2 [Brassica napus]
MCSTVHYCCVSRGNQILYGYNNGGDHHRNESLAALCLEKTPPFHKWYFETISKRTFGFLIEEDGLVYFAIVDEVFKRSSVLEFLENLKDELKKADKKNSRGSFSGSISFNNVQDQLVRRLIASLERVAETNHLTCLPLSSPSIDGAEQSDVAISTKAPLLGRSNKQEKKKKGKDHVNTLRGVEVEEQRKSTDRGNVTESSNASSAAAAAATYVPRRDRSSGSQSIEKKWRRQVKIVLVIDAAICLTLLGVWLAICQGIQCLTYSAELLIVYLLGKRLKFPPGFVYV